MLNELPYFSLHIPTQTWIQVECCTGAIDPLIYVLKIGNPKARENVAATLFSF